MEALHAYVAVVRRGSFTAAAKQLDLPKSTVSRRVAALEERLGVQLLTRTTRSVRPTDVGTAYYERVQGLLASLDEADADIAERDASPRGVLRVTAPSTLGHFYLGAIVLDFARQYPDVQVQLHLSDRVVNVVEEGYDVAVRAGEFGDVSLIARRLGRTGPILCASPEYLCRSGPLDTIDQVLDHDCLVNDGVAWGTKWPLHPNKSLRVKAKLTSNSWEVLREAALAGLGVAYIPDVHVSQHIAAGRLVQLLPQHVAAQAGLWVMYPPTRYLSPKVRAFVDHLVSAFRRGAVEPTPDTL